MSQQLCTLAENQLLQFVQGADWQEGMKMETQLLGVLERTDAKQLEHFLATDLKFLKDYNTKFKQLKGQMFSLLSSNQDAGSKNILAGLTSIESYLTRALQAISKYQSRSPMWDEEKLAFEEENILFALAGLQNEIPKTGLAKHSESTEKFVAWCKQGSDWFQYTRPEIKKRAFRNENKKKAAAIAISANGPCAPNASQMKRFQELTSDLAREKGWTGQDFDSVTRVLRHLHDKKTRDALYLPANFNLSRARFHEASFRPDTPGLRGKRGKLILPSYLYEIAQQGCPHLAEINHMLEEIAEARFLPEESMEGKHLGSHSLKEWNAREAEMLKQDPSQATCLRDFGEDVRDFLALKSLANIHYGKDIHALVNVLGLEHLAQKLPRHRYRVDDLNVPRRHVSNGRGDDRAKQNLLSALLDSNCQNLKALNRFIYAHYLDQRSQERFRKDRLI